VSLRTRFASALVSVLRVIAPSRVAAAMPPPMLTSGVSDPLARPPLAPPPKRKKRRSSRQPQTVTRWLQADVEAAQRKADMGDMRLAARLWRSLTRDGMIIGLLGTLTGGLVRLPKVWKGDADAIAYMQGVEGERSNFERHFPAGELAKFAGDLRGMGVALAELLETPCGPVFCRLDPEYLRYRWYEDRWYYQTIDGEELVTPGDGRWILATSARLEPWTNGLIWCLGRAYVSKEHSFFYRENWNAKLAHAARAAVSPAGATEGQRKGFLDRVIAWGVNTSFELPPGWDVRVIEANGRGYESFKETAQDANQEIMIAIAGQVVTVTGGTGFANADIHATIRSDIIDALGQSLGEVLDEQAIPHVLMGRVANTNCSVRWDTRKPTNRKEEAEALTAAATAIGALVAQFKTLGIEIDALALAQRFNVPIKLVQDILEQAPVMAPEAAAAPASNDGPVEQPVVAEMSPDDEPAQDADVHELARTMTELGIDRCEHGRSNRCPMCGVERVRSVTRNELGEPVWGIGWRPIVHQEAA
jgi:hypothetical protein